MTICLRTMVHIQVGHGPGRTDWVVRREATFIRRVSKKKYHIRFWSEFRTNPNCIFAKIASLNSSNFPKDLIKKVKSCASKISQFSDIFRNFCVQQRTDNKVKIFHVQKFQNSVGQILKCLVKRLLTTELLSEMNSQQLPKISIWQNYENTNHEKLSRDQ